MIDSGKGAMMMMMMIDDDDDDDEGACNTCCIGVEILIVNQHQTKIY